MRIREEKEGEQAQGHDQGEEETDEDMEEMEEEEEEEEEDDDDKDWDPTDFKVEEISKEEYERVKETILDGKAKEAAGPVPELRPAAEPAAQAGWLEDLLGEGTAVAAAEAARPRAEARPQEEAPEADLVS